ncbi:hypothetical protein ACSNOB_10845 [Micromonospora sp. URMC 106]|uniref:hypothetical protein n=1 Tax=Micromonospora sp. URMC 106 TaxID=3423408 RepID=UPI003F1CE69D
MMTLQGIGPLVAGLGAEALGPATAIALTGAAIVLIALMLRATASRHHPAAPTVQSPH